MKVIIVEGDITQVPVDIIVNSANKHLWKGSGVCGAIHAAAGRELENECLKLKQKAYPEGLPVGEVLVTKAYNLPAKYVFHTVGPRMGKDDLSLLRNCYVNCLKKAEALQQSSISFPAISTNRYGVPMELSARIVKEALSNFTSEIIKEVFLVFFQKNDIDIYRKIFEN